MNISKSTVLFFSEINWDYLKQRHQIFSENYAKRGHNLIYVGRTGLRYPRFEDLKKNKAKISTVENTIHQNITLFKGKFFPPINRIFNFINKYFLIPRLVKLIKTKEVIIHYYQPTDLIRDCKNCLINNEISVKLLYDCVQDYRHHPAKNSRLISLEKKLAMDCNLIITDSIINFERLHTDNKLLVPPGVDVEHFRINKLSHSTNKILFFGNIRQDLDIQLLNKIARSRKFELTLLGFLNIPEELLHPQINLKPAVTYSELPAVIGKYDILLLPYATDQKFTEAIIPAKFFECLATNMPIFSTSMKSLNPFKHLLISINSETSFDEIECPPVTKEEKNEREKILSEASWEKRFNTFYSTIISDSTR